MSRFHLAKTTPTLARVFTTYYWKSNEEHLLHNAPPFLFQGEEMRRLLPGILLLALAAGVAGCDDNNDTPTTPTTPTTPSTPTTTETFSGTLTRNGASSTTFTVTAGGTVTATLTTLAPDATVPVGLSLGAWTGSACQVSGISNDAAVQGTVVSGTVTSAAALCVRIYDAAERVNTTMSYTITVVHP
jgi:hypothetical protein